MWTRPAPRKCALLIGVLLAVPFASCARAAPGMDASSFRAATAGFDWRLTELNGRSAPTGAGGRAATVHFDADTARVSGFAGCNRYFGAYTLAGTTLRFHQIGMTKMACSEGMPLEQQLAAALQATRSYELSGTTLTLRSDEGPVARFVRAAP